MKNIKKLSMFYAALAGIMFVLLVQSCKKNTTDAVGTVRTVDSGSNLISNSINNNSTFVTPNSTKVVEGYLTLSQWYGYSYNDINYSNVTHIDFSFMTPTSTTDATLVYQDQANIAAEVSYYSDLTDKSFLGYGDKLLTKAHAANVKVLIGLAGATNLQAIFANSTLTGQFVSNVVNLCAQKGYDGIALDYEYPSTNTDGANILTFIQDLRVAFAKSSVLKNKKMYISMAMPTGDWAAKYYNLASLAKCVDWFSPMTYEYGSATQANINAPLYENPAIGNASSVDDAITYYLNTRGVNPLQLAMGVPFYGSQYTNYTALGAAAIGASRATKDMYNDYIKGGTFTQMWDATSQHTYYVNNSTGMMIVYDDAKDFVTKSAYIKAKGLKGAMIWELSRGFVSGATDPNPWLTALGTGVLH
ncbi:glycoside hydrolase family 18 protein [Mucilaginibacter sp. FT3.2]|uniref:glycoside hydrolase family 18 protein n=1 Tax=Mucilaginibacter sp. FT3.2 TaxID=2723090 RepID=UPI001622F6BB|nr:glycoside hydrolase family 18 protein [Mucilaginibacter sp. FT3.2]MBB6232920.1 GH18 family chitinase [Mucilaginibacter sp. FT3.2]